MAETKYLKNIEKMKSKRQKVIKTFEVGQVVGVKIPSEDRCHVDAPFLPTRIIEKKENDYYKLR